MHCLSVRIPICYFFIGCLILGQQLFFHQAGDDFVTFAAVTVIVVLRAADCVRRRHFEAIPSLVLCFPVRVCSVSCLLFFFVRSTLGLCILLVHLVLYHARMAAPICLNESGVSLVFSRQSTILLCLHFHTDRLVCVIISSWHDAVSIMTGDTSHLE